MQVLRGLTGAGGSTVVKWFWIQAFVVSSWSFVWGPHVNGQIADHTPVHCLFYYTLTT